MLPRHEAWARSTPYNSHYRSTLCLFLSNMSSDPTDIDSSPVGSTATSTAPPPFDKSAADVVLCSSDGVEFHVFRWILEDSSPIFTDMFQLPTDTTGKVQTVDLTETSDTLKRLLELHYPLPPQPQFASFEDAKPILVAADKYQLSKVAPALALAALPRIRVNPLRAYAFAVRHNMLELIRLSAKEFLQVSYMAVYSEELEDITAGAYLRLLAYRKACAASLEGLIASNWYPSVGSCVGRPALHARHTRLVALETSPVGIVIVP